MASNIKPKNLRKEAPTEPFKRAVTGCLRAIARQARPRSRVRGRAARLCRAARSRLPEPPRKLTARMPRSCAAMPIRSRCGSPVTIPAVHRKLVPGGQQARAVFEAVEQARVEAIGSRRMGGVAKNLAAMLDDRFHRGKFDEITDRADAPIEDALALIVRERLTGESPPPAAQQDRRAVASADRRSRRPRSRPARAPDRRPAPLRRRRA